jgi:hypothetical protein
VPKSRSGELSRVRARMDPSCVRCVDSRRIDVSSWNNCCYSTVEPRRQRRMSVQRLHICFGRVFISGLESGESAVGVDQTARARVGGWIVGPGPVFGAVGHSAGGPRAAVGCDVAGFRATSRVHGRRVPAPERSVRSWPAARPVPSPAAQRGPSVRPFRLSRGKAWPPGRHRGN